MTEREHFEVKDGDKYVHFVCPCDVRFSFCGIYDKDNPDRGPADVRRGDLYCQDCVGMLEQWRCGRCGCTTRQMCPRCQQE